MQDAMQNKNLAKFQSAPAMPSPHEAVSQARDLFTQCKATKAEHEFLDRCGQVLEDAVEALVRERTAAAREREAAVNAAQAAPSKKGNGAAPKTSSQRMALSEAQHDA